MKKNRSNHFQAMRRHSEIVEKMAELMTELPDVVESCEQYSDIYPGRNELQQRVKDLYIDILAALEYFVKWYMQGTLSPKFPLLHSYLIKFDCL